MDEVREWRGNGGQTPALDAFAREAVTIRAPIVQEAMGEGENMKEKDAVVCSFPKCGKEILASEAVTPDGRVVLERKRVLYGQGGKGDEKAKKLNQLIQGLFFSDKVRERYPSSTGFYPPPFCLDCAIRFLNLIGVKEDRQEELLCAYEATHAAWEQASKAREEEVNRPAAPAADEANGDAELAELTELAKEARGSRPSREILWKEKQAPWLDRLVRDRLTADEIPYQEITGLKEAYIGCQVPACRIHGKPEDRFLLKYRDKGGNEQRRQVPKMQGAIVRIAEGGKRLVICCHQHARAARKFADGIFGYSEWKENGEARRRPNHEIRFRTLTDMISFREEKAARRAAGREEAQATFEKKAADDVAFFNSVPAETLAVFRNAKKGGRRKKKS